MRAVGIICARGGSKGIPRKNVRLLAGKPLIAHTIETAIKSTALQRLVVSTEDDEIAAVAREYGAEVPFRRPPELAQDGSPHWDVWRHALAELASQGDRVDILVDMHTTCPFRTVGDIDGAVSLLLKNEEADGVITVCEAKRNPYYNMVRLSKDDHMSLVIPPQTPVARRQDAPRIYELNTAVYALRAEYIRRAPWLFEGRVLGYVMPAERSLDIDTELDLEYAQFLMQRSEHGRCDGSKT